jgi:hypothetical protein
MDPDSVIGSRKAKMNCRKGKDEKIICFERMFSLHEKRFLLELGRHSWWVFKKNM